MQKNTNIKGDYGKILLSDGNENWPPIILKIQWIKNPDFDNSENLHIKFPTKKDFKELKIGPEPSKLI